MSAALQTEGRPSSVDDAGIAGARGPQADAVVASKPLAAGRPQPAPAAVAACSKTQADLEAIEGFAAKLMTSLQAKPSGAVPDGPEIRERLMCVQAYAARKEQAPPAVCEAFYQEVAASC